MRRTDLARELFVRGRAHAMRHQMEPAEARLWAELEPLGFKAQVPLTLARLKTASHKDYYVLDFYHEGAKLCIEVDGGIHRQTKGRDRRRDTRLKIAGIQTLRVPNAQVFNHLPDVVKGIREALWKLQMI